jgi:hypothetical protein
MRSVGWPVEKTGVLAAGSPQLAAKPRPFPPQHFAAVWGVGIVEHVGRSLLRPS